jgi:hypothetical protein
MPARQVVVCLLSLWQSVMFIGYGDNREVSDADRLEKLDRQFFVKLSYACQRSTVRSVRL